MQPSALERAVAVREGVAVDIPRGGPVPNVAKTPLVGGQWQSGGDWPLDLVITSNTLFEDIPLGGETSLKVWP